MRQLEYELDVVIHCILNTIKELFFKCDNDIVIFLIYLLKVILKH